MDIQLDKTGVEADKSTIDAVKSDTDPKAHNKGVEIIRRNIGTCIDINRIAFGDFWRKKIGIK